MKARSIRSVVVIFGALANVACMVDSQDGQESIPGEEVGTVQSAATTNGWTEWSSGNCGPGGCGTIINPICANGSFASKFERNASGSSYRIFCQTTAGLTGTQNHSWLTSCPTDKIGTGIQCISTGSACSPMLRCSSPVGRIASEPYTLTTQSGLVYTCPQSSSTVRYLKQARGVNGVCGVLWGF